MTSGNIHRKRILENRLAELFEEYEAVNRQLGHTLNEADRLRLNRQIKYLDKSIKELEDQILELAKNELVMSLPVIRNQSATSFDYLIWLKDILTSRFNLSELSTLCFHLNVDFEDLPLDGKSSKVEELVMYMERRQRIPELVKMGKYLRPDISWD